MCKLYDYIGEPALFEQTAEECVELAHASLKMARLLRNENKVHGKTKNDILESVHEEIADILMTIDELRKAELIDNFEIEKWKATKRDRMKRRLLKEM